MAAFFQPQFHRHVVLNGHERAWIALPYPNSVIAAKAIFYQHWQIEERMKLEKAGETVVTPIQMSI